MNRFSRVLEENEINHMYSSTYKTANLLVSLDPPVEIPFTHLFGVVQVDKKNAGRAQAVLRSC